jgi:hypothetical protein
MQQPPQLLPQPQLQLHPTTRSVQQQQPQQQQQHPTTKSLHPQQPQQLEQMIIIKDALAAYSINEQQIFLFIKNVILNLMVTIKPLRVKLASVLQQPDVIYVDVLKVYEENKTKFTPNDITNIKTIVSVTSSVTELNGIFLDAFTKIMADGKIDMNDSVHFMTFMYEIVHLFNAYTTNQNFKIAISSDSVLNFLFVIVKSILMLTLENEQERVAISMLDASMKLIQISVLPITKCSCNRGCFSFNSASSPQ